MNKTQLTRHQKEAIGLLSFGTFLEYFDLMLYIHMAVLLNELFFPKTNDPYIISLYAALAFCSNYIFRPIGGFIIGWIGDKMGRKVTVMITSFTMAIACIVIATTKTYAEIGIAATITITICRILQGFSSMGEITGAYMYCAESLKSPLKYSMSTLIVVFAQLGGLFALIISFIALRSAFDWRLAFWIGAGIAVIGFVARTRLRETAEFADFKRRMRNKAEQSGQDIKAIENLAIYREKVDIKAALSYFVISFPATIWKYIAYIYAAVILKNTFGFNTEEIIIHNFGVAISGVLVNLMYAYLVKKIHPLKITKYRIYFIFLFLPFIPYYLNNLTSPWEVMLLQILVFSVSPSTGGHLDALCYKYFPIAKRFTTGAFIFGVSHSLGYVLSSFGFVYIMHCFGSYGIWVYTTPILIAYVFAVKYIKKLEIKDGSYHDYPNEGPGNEDTALKEEAFDYELGNEYEPFKGACQYSIQLLSKLDAVGREMDKKINIKLVEKAITFAKYWHDEQIRKVDNSPYYSHPLMVAGTVAEH
jgi:MHS family proline/betaine transporter-like MFS transporter